MDEILADEMSVDGPVRGREARKRQMALIEVVEDAMHRIEHGPVGVILPAPVLIH